MTLRTVTGGIRLVLAAWLLAGTAAAVAPDQQARWGSAVLNPRDSIRLDKAVALYRRTESRYQRIEAMRSNGVPAPFVFCMHMRESDNDFTRHAHEGSPLTHRTRDEPKGRIPGLPPPYTFEQSAEDAYYVADRLHLANWRSLQSALDKLESFNGFGYRGRNVAAPYLWSGTNLYTRGKYVADGKYSPIAVDRQLGCAAVLLRMQARGIPLPFSK